MLAIDCGIDIGSTNLKVVMVGDGGRVLYTRSIPAPRVSDGVGLVTDAFALVQELEGLIIDGWREVGNGQPLRSIAAAGVGEDGVGIDSDFMPLGYALPWFDKRATGEVQILQRHAYLSTRAGIAIDADRTACKWLWLRHNRPQDLATAQYWIALTDFPAVWWSGNAFISNSLAPRTACYDVYKRQWIDELLLACHAPPMPPLMQAGQIVGGVRTGPLRESGAASSTTLVVAGGHDHPVAATIIRRHDATARVDSMGTANLVYGETNNAAAKLQDPLLAYSLPPTGDKGIACLGVLEMSSALQAIEQDSVYLRSYLAQTHLQGSPSETANRDASKLQDRNSRIRSGLETASFKALRLFDAMDSAGVPHGAIYSTGGWSRSRAFVELRASVFGEAINVIGDMELTAIGAALFGAEAATGQSVCPFKKEDIVTIAPVKNWAIAYQSAYREYINASPSQ
jgi:xylulokinase